MLCSSKPKAPASARGEFTFTHTGKVLEESTVPMKVGNRRWLLDGSDGRYVQPSRVFVRGLKTPLAISACSAQAAQRRQLCGALAENVVAVIGGQNFACVVQGELSVSLG